MANFERTFKLDQVRGIDEKARSVSLSFSSEYPVDRGDYDEVLSHAAGDADLSRLNDAHPVLLNHNTDAHVATVTRAWIDGTKGRATVKFSKSTRAESVWQDVKDGILQHVSVGYEIVRKVASKKLANGRELIRFAWRPYEISLVPVPADPHVGVGRSKTITNTRIFMSDENDQNDQDQNNEHGASRRDRRSEEQRVRSINAAVAALSENHPEQREKFNHMASEAILKGTPTDIFNHGLLRAIAPRAAQLTDANIGMSQRDVNQYSLQRAILGMMDRGRLDGLELEAHRAEEKRCGRPAAGFYIPNDVTFGKRDFTAGVAGSGGNFVPTMIPSTPIELLRNRMVVNRLGALNFSGLSGNVAVPRQTAAATAYSLGESATLTKSTQAIDQVLLTPHRVGAYNEYSKQLVLQSTVDVENFLRNDLMAVLAIKLDKLAIDGSGSTSEPTGILNTSGIGSVTFGAAASYAKMVAFETALAVANADDGKMAYITTPSVRSKLKTAAKIGSTFPLFIWERGEWNDGSNDGMVNDYRAAVTNQIASDLVYFGNFNDLITALWGGVDCVINPYVRDIDAMVRITMNVFADVALRHAASFAVSSDSGAQ